MSHIVFPNHNVVEQPLLSKYFLRNILDMRASPCENVQNCQSRYDIFFKLYGHKNWVFLLSFIKLAMCLKFVSKNRTDVEITD